MQGTHGAFVQTLLAVIAGRCPVCLHKRGRRPKGRRSGPWLPQGHGPGKARQCAQLCGSRGAHYGVCASLRADLPTTTGHTPPRTRLATHTYDVRSTWLTSHTHNTSSHMSAALHDEDLIVNYGHSLCIWQQWQCSEAPEGWREWRGMCSAASLQVETSGHVHVPVDTSQPIHRMARCRVEDAAWIRQQRSRPADKWARCCNWAPCTLQYCSCSTS
jgi:hypothetical protein